MAADRRDGARVTGFGAFPYALYAAARGWSRKAAKTPPPRRRCRQCGEAGLAGYAGSAAQLLQRHKARLSGSVAMLLGSRRIALRSSVDQVF